jgi:hypothetical protein
MPAKINHLRTRLKNLDTRRERLHADQAVIDKAAGDHLRQLRIERRLKLHEIAKSAGFSIGKLWDIEQGDRVVGLSLETFDQVAQAIEEVAR